MRAIEYWSPSQPLVGKRHLYVETGADVAYSWRRIANSGSRRRRKVEVDQRCTLDRGKKVELLYLGGDAPMGLSQIWDLIHSAEPDTIIAVTDTIDLDFLGGPAYASSVRVLETWRDGEVRRAVDERLPHKSIDSEAWTFGVPTGGRDATQLNVCVQRLLSIKCSRKEIILCGEPPVDFAFRDQVRIIPDPCPGEINLPAKKNALADAATNEMLCLLHDRVLLDENFPEEVRRFGPAPGFLGLATYYFFDENGMCGRRYSDLNRVDVARDYPRPSERFDIEAPRNPLINQAIASEIGRFSQFSYVPLRGGCRETYLTGSLYICETRLWRSLRQSEQLTWEHFEDVEFGLRCAKLGVPHRIAPRCAAISLSARSAVADGHSTTFSRGDADYGVYNLELPFLGLKLARRRSLVVGHRVGYAHDVQRFLQTWGLYGLGLDAAALVMKLDSPERMEALGTVLQACDIALILSVEDLERFIVDFEKLVLRETLEVGDRGDIIKHVRFFDANLFARLLENWTVQSQCRLVGGRLMDFLGDGVSRLPKPMSRRQRIGLAIFVLHSWLFARDELCPPGGALRFYLSLVRTWPKARELDEALVSPVSG